MNAARPPGAELPDLRVQDLGAVCYAEALELQRRLHAGVVAARDDDVVATPMHLLLLEHDPPVITVSRRRTARSNLVAGDAVLMKEGIEVAETDRGGDITYHGPGQLVVYPIIDLNALGLRLHSYMRFLEEITIQTLSRFGVKGERDPGATGVWVPRADNARRPPRKICAIGVRVSRWVAMHGLALNVAPNLEHFKLIVPCGLAGREVTSLHQELGDACPPMSRVKREMVASFQREISRLTAVGA